MAAEEVAAVSDRVGSSLEAALNAALDSQWQRAVSGVASKRRMAPDADADSTARAIVRDFRREW